MRRLPADNHAPSRRLEVRRERLAGFARDAMIAAARGLTRERPAAPIGHDLGGPELALLVGPERAQPLVHHERRHALACHDDAAHLGEVDGPRAIERDEIELGREPEAPIRPVERRHEPEGRAGLGAPAVRGKTHLFGRACGLRQIAALGEEGRNGIRLADRPGDLLRDPRVHPAPAFGRALRR